MVHPLEKLDDIIKEKKKNPIIIDRILHCTLKDLEKKYKK